MAWWVAHRENSEGSEPGGLLGGRDYGNNLLRRGCWFLSPWALDDTPAAVNAFSAVSAPLDLSLGVQHPGESVCLADTRSHTTF